jgi:hypothetical protein
LLLLFQRLDILYTIINDSIEEKEFKEKESVLSEHLEQTWWVFNNLKMDGQNVWQRPNLSFPGFVTLNKISFLLRNNSPVDISSFTITFDIYDAEGKPFLIRDMNLQHFIRANSINPIEQYLNDPEFQAVPVGFTWSSRLKSVEPDERYINSKTLQEIKEFIMTDSKSLQSPVQIDWEGLAKSLDSLDQKNK